MFSGAGVNLTYKTARTLQYNAVGCLSLGFGREAGESYSKYRCGISVGLVVAGYIPKISEKSTLDFHLGLWHEKDRNGITETKSEYGIGYIYFTNGLNNKGLLYGFTPVYVVQNNENEFEYRLNFGYQFK